MDATTAAISAAFLFATAVAPASALESFAGITCDYVRSLSREEQDYWSKRLGLTQAQRHRIFVACYENDRPKESNTVAKIGK